MLSQNQTQLSKPTDQIHFCPPFCPNPGCKNHEDALFNFYKLNGWCQTQKSPGWNRRYKCKVCLHQFSYNTFQLDFRRRLISLNKKVFEYSLNGMSNSSISRLLGVTERVVRNRLGLLARQAVLFEKLQEDQIKIEEPVSYDGFETFSGSQFSPCYINTAVGKSSLFTYAATFSPMNRKGRMTKWQKNKNELLRSTFGPYPNDAIRVQTTYVLSKLERSSQNHPIILHTDEHKSYQLAIKQDFKSETFEHKLTNSKERRDPKNPLFPVNHLHLNYRHFLAAHKRETIAFQKNEAALMDKIILMRVYKNFMRPRYFKEAKEVLPSPAMNIGLSSKILHFEEVFDRRRFVTKSKLDHEEMSVYRREYSYSRVPLKRYQGM